MLELKEYFMITTMFSDVNTNKDRWSIYR